MNVTNAKKTVYIIGSYCAVMNAPKYPSVDALTLSPVRYATKYFITQPPITQ